MLTLMLFLLCLSAANALLPTLCCTETALATRNCCPDYNGSPCGINEGRGECRLLPKNKAMGKEPMSNDDRFKYPSFYYDKICFCKPNFDGANCGSCSHGRDPASNCAKKRLLERRDIREYTETERHAFFATLNYCKRVTCPDYKIIVTGDRQHKDTYNMIHVSYLDTFNFLHYYSTKAILSNNTFIYTMNFAHYSSAFLTWHRAMLIFLESLFQSCISDPYFTLPYGDWRNDPGCELCNDDFLGASDKNGDLSKYSVFSTWTCVCSEYDYINRYCMMSKSECERQKICRKPGYGPGSRKPNAQDVENALKFPIYDTPPYSTRSVGSFRPVIEGFVSPVDGRTPATALHNLWHVYLGGTMSRVPVAACDPMFILHHCFIDKIFNTWIRRYNITPAAYPIDITRPGHMDSECMFGYVGCKHQSQYLTDIEAYGIKYSGYANFQ